MAGTTLIIEQHFEAKTLPALEIKQGMGEFQNYDKGSDHRCTDDEQMPRP